MNRRRAAAAQRSGRVAFAALAASAYVAMLACIGCNRRPPPSPSGAILYQRYCASCHGTDGKGNGPVAAALKRPPTDLTTLARRAGGRFDETEIIAIIDGRRAVQEHGPREMPVWGAIFDAELKEQPYGGYTTLLRAQILADHLRKLQID